MAIIHDEERAGRVERLLEELRLNTEDLQDLAKDAIQRAKADHESTRLIRAGTAHPSRARQAIGEDFRVHREVCG